MREAEPRFGVTGGNILAGSGIHVITKEEVLQTWREMLDFIEEHPDIALRCWRESKLP